MKIYNRKFQRDYEEIENFEAGMALTGAEVKSIRDGRMKLDDAYIKLLDDGPYLINAQIYRYKYAPTEDQDEIRSRKLLLSKAEILRIKTKIRGGGNLTIVPVMCYNKGNLIKLKIAVVRGRREVEKRKLEKTRDIKRQEKREVKEYLKR